MSASTERAFHKLRLRQLELVCVLSETGTVRGASERMHVSPPALSKSLREVERFAGTALFTRSAQGMRPTPAGEAFIQHARAILQRVPGLRESARDVLDPPLKAMLRVGTAPFVAWQLFPAVLKAMAVAGDMPRIHFAEGRIMSLAEQLVHGDLDAIVTLLTPEAVEVLGTESLVLEQVRIERLFIVGAPTESPRRTSWKALAERRWILPPVTYTARRHVQRAFLQAGVLPPEPFFESHNIPASLALARCGLGITPAFESTTRDDFATGALVRLRGETELDAIPIGIAFRKGAGQAAGIRSLRNAMQAHTR